MEAIKKKVSVIPTDSGEIGGDVPNRGGVATLFELLKLANRLDLHTKYAQDYKDKNIRYSEMKEDVSTAIFEVLRPIQERRAEIEANFNFCNPTVIGVEPFEFIDLLEMM